MTNIGQNSIGQQKKYCHLYLVRHGETNWNAKNLVQGHSDIPLNKNGEKQTKQLAKKLKKIKFAAVFSSDLLRAKRTAEIIAAEHNLTIITKQVLRERYFGDLEGKSAKWLEIWRKKLEKGVENLTTKEKNLIKKIKNGGESDEELMIRFIPFLRQAALAYPGKKVLIVTHGGILRVFLLRLGFFKDEKESFNFQIKNCALVEVLSDGVEFFIKKTFGVERIKSAI